MGQDQGVTRRAALGLGAAAAAATVLAVKDAGAAQSDPEHATKATITLAEAHILLEARGGQGGGDRRADVPPRPRRERPGEGVGPHGRQLPGGAHVGAAQGLHRGAFHTATHQLARNVGGDPVRSASFLASGQFTLLGGGLPIRRGDDVIGAVGVGGGSPEQDVVVGQAGLDALAAAC